MADSMDSSRRQNKPGSSVPRRDSLEDASNSKLSQQSRFGNNPWRDEERKHFVSLLKKHGKNFALIAQELGTRSVDQCRNYFQNYKAKLNLR